MARRQAPPGQNTESEDPLSTAQAARREGRVKDARALYEQVLAQAPEGARAERARVGLKLLEAAGKPPGGGGRQAIGLILAGFLFGYLALLVLPQDQYWVALTGIVACVGAGIISALIALFRGGLANRLAGLSAIALLAVLFYPALRHEPAPELRGLAVDGIILASGAKAGVHDAWEQTGRLPSSNAEASLPAPAELGAGIVERIEVRDAGRIVITFKGSELGGQTLVLRPEAGTGGIEWDCTGGSLAAAARPGYCRSR